MYNFGNAAKLLNKMKTSCPIHPKIAIKYQFLICDKQSSRPDTIGKRQIAWDGKTKKTGNGKSPLLETLQLKSGLRPAILTQERDCLAKRPVSASKTGRFGVQNSPFQAAKRAILQRIGSQGVTQGARNRRALS